MLRQDSALDAVGMNRSLDRAGTGTVGKRVLVIWALIFALLIRCAIIGRMRSASEFATVDAYNFVQIVLIFLLAGWLLIGSEWYRMLGALQGRAAWFFISIYVMGIVSALWSDYPEYSAYRAFEALIVLGGIFCAFWTYRSLHKAENAFLNVALLTIAVNFIGLVKRHRVSVFQDPVAGLHNSGYSIPAMILLCYCLGELFDDSRRVTKGRRRKLGACAIAAGTFLVASTSSGSYISGAVGLGLIGLLSRKRSVRPIRLLAVVFLAFGLWISHGDTQLSQVFFVGKDEQAIQTMSGRLGFWELYWEQIGRNPILGSAFAVMPRQGQMYATHSHNAYIGVVGGMGLVGGALAAAFLLKLGHELLTARRQRLPGYLGASVALAAGLMNACTKSYFWEAFETASIPFFAVLAFFSLHVLRPPRSQGPSLSA